MNVGINSIPQIELPLSDIAKPDITPGEAQAGFADTLKSAIENVNKAQVASDKQTQRLAAGKTDNLHDVMITAQKASITLEMTVQVQRKAIDAYIEMMRMQV